LPAAHRPNRQPQKNLKISWVVTAETAFGSRGSDDQAQETTPIRTHWRRAVNKILIAAAAAFLAVTTFGAQAGFNVRLSAPAGFSTVEKAGCGGGGYSSYKKRRYSSIKRAKRKAYLAAKQRAAAKRIAAKKAAQKRIAAEKAAAAKAARLAQQKEEAKAEQQVALATTADSENSSIAASTGKPAKAETAKGEPDDEEEKVAVAKDPGCKQFFPSVGMTLSVPCQ
jgi:hypothetical protein